MDKKEVIKIYKKVNRDQFKERQKDRPINTVTRVILDKRKIVKPFNQTKEQDDDA